MQPSCSKPVGKKQQLCMLVCEPGHDSTIRVKLTDVICWRALEGRPCISAEQLCRRQSVQVALIPIPPSGRAEQAGARKQANTAIQQVASDASAASAASVPAVSAAATTQQHSNWEQLVLRCQEVLLCLVAGGLTCLVDDDARQTPGSKFNKWEREGVPLRVEIGTRELGNGTACLVVHPAWRNQVEAALSDIGLLQPVPASSAAATNSSTAATSSSASQQRKAAGRMLRLPGLRTEQLSAACQAVCAACLTSQPAAALQAGAGTAPHSVWNNPVLDAADVQLQEQQQGPGANNPPDPQCTKLHLWPGCNKPHVLWSAAGLLPLLQQSCSQQDQGVQPLLMIASHQLQLPEPGLHADINPRDDRSVGQISSRGTSSGSGTSTADQPLVCAEHVRHLCGVAQACHCGVGHPQLAVLQQHVEHLYEQQGRGCIASWLLPQHHQQCASQLLNDSNAQTLDVDENEGQDATDSSSMCNSDDDQQLLQPQHTAAAKARRYKNQGAVLLVTGIPAGSPAAAVRSALADLLAAAGLQQARVRVSRGRTGGTLGWARLVLPTQDMAMQAVQQLNGSMLQASHAISSSAYEGMPAAAAQAALTPTTASSLAALPHCRIWVSPSCGRKDTLFCHIHSAAVRARLRVDSVATFSITDAVTAHKMTQLITAILAQLPTQQAASSASRQNSGWVAVDGTACAGGNTLALAEVCSQVLAVEQDKDRADDLLFNLRLLGHIPPPPSSTASSHRAMPHQEQPAGEGGQGGMGASGEHVRVLCGDFTHLWPHMTPAHVVLLDPPWGGPDYKQHNQRNKHHHEASAAAEATGLEQSQDHSKNDANHNDRGVHVGSCASVVGGCPQGPGLMLGDVPLCRVAGGLLGSHKCDVVALKLPTSGAQKHADLLQCTAQHAASTIARGSSSSSSKDKESVHLWAARAQFGRAALLTIVRIAAGFGGHAQSDSYGWVPHSCNLEQVQLPAASADHVGVLHEQVQALRTALRQWGQQEGVAYQVLGTFACTTSD